VAMRLDYRMTAWTSDRYMTVKDLTVTLRFATIMVEGWSEAIFDESIGPRALMDREYDHPGWWR
jgi:hypothetical protein